jgi:diacylglycerol kinase (ATP)
MWKHIPRPCVIYLSLDSLNNKRYQMKEESKKFSIPARINSFGFAFKGIAYVLKHEHNAWIHVTAAITAVTLGLILRISLHEWIAVALCIGLVLASEIINSAIEKMVDLISPEQQPKAGLIKDIAAGAVLIASIAALAIGCLVFIPYFIQ